MKITKAIEGFEISRIAEGYSQSTIKSYKYSLVLFAQYVGCDRELESITVNDLKMWFYHLRTDYEPHRKKDRKTPLAGASIHGKWKAVRSFFNWSHEELKIENIALQFKAPDYETKEIVPFNQKEIKALLSACEYTAPARTGRRIQYRQKRPTAIRDRAILLLLLDTGLRVGECTRLQIADIDLDSGEINVKPFGRGKKSKGRVVYIGKTAKKALWRYLATKEDAGKYDSVFLSDDGQPLTIGAVKSLFQKLGKRAGVEGTHPHRCRHTFAIQYLRNGGDVFTLQRLLGHSTLEMVNNYLAIAMSDSASAHRRASPADNWDL